MRPERVDKRQMPPKQIRKGETRQKKAENVNEMESVKDNLDIGKLVEECLGCESNSLDSLEKNMISSDKKSLSPD